MFFANDLHLSIRQLRQQPSFAVIVIVTLALTVGAATTVFGLFDAVLLRPLPYRDEASLVRLQTYEPSAVGTTREVSLYEFQDWKRDSRSFTAMAAYFVYGNNLTGQGPARLVRMAFTTPELFELVGVRPHLGRLFTGRDDQLGGDVRQLVLSYGLWQELFAAAPGAIGKTVQLRGQSYTIIGVMPPGFNYPDHSQVWVPLMARYSTYSDSWWKRRDARVNSVLARLRPGVSLEQANSELESLAASQQKLFPDTNHNVHIRATRLRDLETGEIRPYVLLVSGGVLLLLLIGCVNVANLFVARATSREREFAIRSALGMRRWRLLQHLLSESLLLSMIGGACGAGLASTGLRILNRAIPVPLPTFMSLSVDARVLSFSLALSVITAVLFSLTPLLQTRPDLNDVLKQGTRGSFGHSITGRMRSSLVIAEVALSLLLLIGAGLMLRSFEHVMSVSTGVRTKGILVAGVERYLANVSDTEGLVGYSDQYRRMAERISALPGVIAVGGAADFPYFRRHETRQTFEWYTRTRTTREQAYRGPAEGSDIMPGYFDVAGIPLLEGRDFTDADTLGSPKVAIINRRAAELLFPGQSALGQEIRWGTDDWIRVIGVVGDVRWHPAETMAGVEMYWPYRQFPGPEMNFLIRSDLPFETLAPLVRKSINDVNLDFAIPILKPMETIANDAVWQRRLWGYLLAVFAGVALTLAAIGLYGVMSYLVSRRTQEIGIRMAIGAKPLDVLRHMLGSGFRLVCVGAGLGLLGSLALGKGLRSLLFDISAADPATYIAVTACLAFVALLACAVPAWRASRVDPLVALRDE